MPADLRREHSADARSERQSDVRRRELDAEAASTLVRRDGSRDDRRTNRHQHRRADALKDARSDESAEVEGGSAHHGAKAVLIG